MEYLREALTNGISNEAIEATIVKVLTKSDELKITPNQMYKMIDTYISMKDTPNTLNPKYISDYVEKNNSKIIAVLESGLTAEEIREAMEYRLSTSDRNLPFAAKLISETKSHDFKNQRHNQKELL